MSTECECEGISSILLVELKMMSGDSFCVEIDDAACVQDLKSKVFHLRGIPPDCQQILQGAAPLSDLCAVKGVYKEDSEPMSLVVSLEGVLQALETGSIVATIRSLDLLTQFVQTDDRLHEVCRRCLQHSHEDVRRAALRALLRTSPEESVLIIRECAKDRSCEVRQDAMEALRTIPWKDVRALQAAVAGSTDAHAAVRLSAIQTMEALVGPGCGVEVADMGPCIAQLQALVGDADAGVREAAFGLLCQFEAARITQGSAAEAVEKLLKGPASRDWSTWLWALGASKFPPREQAAQVLDRLADGCDVEEVLQGMSPDGKCRVLTLLRHAPCQDDQAQA